MQEIMAAIVRAVSANLDTFSVAVSYGIKKIKIPMASNILISLLTTIGTFLSMEFGLLISEFIPSILANAIGGIAITLIGIWFLIDYFKERNKDTIPMADSDNSGDISLQEALPLIIALTVNNLGVGISGSMAGVSTIYTTTFTFIITVLFLVIGTFAGKTVFGRLFGKYTPLISNILLILLGIYEIFF